MDQKRNSLFLLTTICYISFTTKGNLLITIAIFLLREKLQLLINKVFYIWFYFFTEKCWRIWIGLIFLLLI